MEYAELYQVYILENNEPVKVLETYDFSEAKRTLERERKLGKKGAHIQYAFKDGGPVPADQKDSIYSEWKELVNMTPSELSAFLETEEGKEAGLSRSEASELGIGSGKESASWILKMKDTPKAEWTDEMWSWAKRQISFIKRMSGNQGDLFNDKGEKTRKHTSLLIWGHDPKKMKYGDLVDSGSAKKYSDWGVRSVAHLLKQGNQKAVEMAAEFLAEQVSEGDLLIPMPTRHGCTTDNHALYLANEISKLTGAAVYQGLCGKDRESLYQFKKEHHAPEEMDMGMYLSYELPVADNYWIVDNVIGTGYSMKNAQEVVGHNAKPLVYAVDLDNVKYADGGAAKKSKHQIIVDENLDFMGTNREEWSAVPIISEEETDVKGKIRKMPIFELPKGYSKAPSLFPNQGSEPYNCELCGQQNLSTLYYLQNDKKQWLLAVGSECVKHFEEGKSGIENVRDFRLEKALRLDRIAIELKKSVKDNFSREEHAGYGKYHRVWKSFMVSNIPSKKFEVLTSKKSSDYIYFEEVYKNIPTFGYDQEAKNNFYGRSKETVEKDLLSWLTKNEKKIEQYVDELSVVFKYFDKNFQYDTGGVLPGSIKVDKTDDGGTITYYVNDIAVGYLEYTYNLSGPISEDLENFNSEMYLLIVEVQKENRGSGIATKLIEEAIRIARELQIEVVSLRRESGMGCDYGGEYDQYLKRIYEKIGFVENNKDCGMILKLNNFENAGIIPVYDVINGEKKLNSLYHNDKLIMKTGGSLPGELISFPKGESDKRNYRVRFHLGLGKNFMHWKIEEIQPRHDYFYDPKEYQLVMSNCKLTNRPKTALKIFLGEMDKAPIAFIECENLSVIEGGEMIIPSVSERIFYNPRKSPYWLDESGNIIDNSVFDVLFTYKTSVYVKHNDKTYEVGGWLDENGHSASHVARFDVGGKTDPKSCEFTPNMVKQGNQLLLFSEVSDLKLTKENVREYLRNRTEEAAEPQMTVLSFGAGQDSFAILYKIIHDEKFRMRYAPKDLMVVMSDTGNEHPHTYKAVEKARKICEENGIHFALLTSDMGYHTPGWLSLKDNLKRNATILSAQMKRKPCTASLKIAPLDKYVYEYICLKYGYPYKLGSKNGFKLYKNQFRSKVRILIGFAKNEETRAIKSVMGAGSLNKWKQLYFEFAYPLIEEGIDREKAIKIIADHSNEIIYPSNCMICFYQSDVELVWLERFHPEEFADWVEMESAKLDKFEGREVNHGVYGKITLTEKLAKAKENSDPTMFGGKKYGDYTDEELWEYKLSHGHCVKSVY